MLVVGAGISDTGDQYLVIRDVKGSASGDTGLFICFVCLIFFIYYFLLTFYYYLVIYSFIFIFIFISCFLFLLVWVVGRVVYVHVHLYSATQNPHTRSQ